jgi:hypothetical protein
MADQPRVNGIDYDYASIEIQLDGALFISIQDISYKHGCKPGYSRGTHPQALGRTTGEYEATGSMTLSKSAATELHQQLGSGYMTKQFDIVVTYAPPGQDMITDRLLGVRITDEDNSHSSGTDGLSVSIELDIRRLQLDGMDPIPNMF